MKGKKYRLIAINTVVECDIAENRCLTTVKVISEQKIDITCDFPKINLMQLQPPDSQFVLMPGRRWSQ